MAAPHPRNSDFEPDSDPQAPRIIRLRVVTWDVISTIALLALLVVLATATRWPEKLFGFLSNVCTEDTCGPLPYQIALYLYPLVWGAIGAAVTAAVVGPIVSLLKGWYMSFWPVLALAIVVLSSVAGSLLTNFSQRFWR